MYRFSFFHTKKCNFTHKFIRKNAKNALSISTPLEKCPHPQALKVNCVEKPTLPLSAYTNMDAFKLFSLDVGLLNAMAQIDPKILLEKNLILTEFKGALTEQFVAQQLKIKHDIYYWTTPNSIAEIDFLIQKQNEIIPIEVKAEENLKSKSLKVFVEKYAPTTAIRTSMSRFRTQDWMVNIPLYGIDGL